MPLQDYKSQSEHGARMVNIQHLDGVMVNIHKVDDVMMNIHEDDDVIRITNHKWKFHCCGCGPLAWALPAGGVYGLRHV